MLGGLRMVADVDLTPWAAGATIAAAVCTILTAIAIGLTWLARSIARKIESSATATKQKFDEHAKAVKDRFDSQDSESARFREEMLDAVERLETNDRDLDRRVTRVEARQDEAGRVQDQIVKTLVIGTTVAT